MPSSFDDRIAVSYAHLLPSIAVRFLKEPTSRAPKEWRWGTNGSLSIDIPNGRWFHHEDKIGGGVLDFIVRYGGQPNTSAAWQWMADEYGLHKKNKVVAEYIYYDLSGNKLFCKRRYEPKKFSQHAWRDGKWQAKLGNVDTVIYRLPEVRHEISEQSTIFVVEGEKDADNLWAIGIPATTNPEGSSKWKPQYTEQLHGANVVIIPDNDDVGVKHALLVANALSEVATVRILNLHNFWDAPPKADVSDFIAAGGTMKQLYDYAEEADVYKYQKIEENPPDWEPVGEPIIEPEAKPLEFVSPRAWISLTVPEVVWLAHQRIPRARVSLLNGHGGIGKTTISLQLVVATVLGTDWLGTVIDTPGPAVYFTAEEDSPGMHRHLAQVTRTIGERGDVFSRLSDSAASFVCRLGQSSILGAADKRDIVQPTLLFNEFQERINDIKPALVVIEAAANVFAGNENNRGSVQQFVGLLSALAVSSGAAILLQQHPSLSGLSNGTGMSGSTHWHNAVRARLNFRAVPEDDEDDMAPGPEKTTSLLRELIVAKSNYGPINEKITLQWDDGRYVLEKKEARYGEDTRVKDTTLELIRRQNEKGIPLSPARNSSCYAPVVLERLPTSQASGIGHKSYERAIEALMRDGKVEIRNCGGGARQVLRFFVTGFTTAAPVAGEELAE